MAQDQRMEWSRAGPSRSRGDLLGGGRKLWEALKALLLDQALLYSAAEKLCWIEGEASTSPSLCPPSQFPPNATLLFPWVVGSG